VKRAIAGTLVAALITVAILETAIRVLRVIPDDVPMTYHAAAGDESYAPDPNALVRSVLGIWHRTNSHGLRGPERPLERTVGRPRVAVVGDSVVWGFGIDQEDTISAWLERLASNSGSAIEAWNLGVVAYNTYNEKGEYARLAPLLRPDVTIVVVLFNDLQSRPEYFRITSVGTLADPRLHAPYPDGLRPFLEKSALFHAAIHLYWSAAPPSRGGRASDLANLPNVLDQLEQIRRIASGVGSALIIAAMPSAVPEASRFGALAEALRRYCEQRHVAFVDLSDTLGRPPRHEYLLPSDPVHPTAQGAKLVAEALASRVIDVLKQR
jgi:lysophospholipase L1-like esterase